TGGEEHDEVEGSLGIGAVGADGDGVGAGIGSGVVHTTVHGGVVEQAPVELSAHGVVDLRGDVVGKDNHGSLAEADLVLAAGKLIGSAVHQIAGVDQVDDLLSSGDGLRLA